MTWVPILIGAWFVAAVGLGLVIGRTVHAADVVEHTEDPPAAPPDEPDAAKGPAGGRPGSATARRKARAEDRAAAPHSSGS